MAFKWTETDTKRILENPHLLGLLADKDKLTELHSEWIKYIWGTLDEHRSLQAHRGSYKTTAITVIGPIWNMLFHPSERIAIIRKTFTDASACLLTVRRLMALRPMMAIFDAVQGITPKVLTKRDDSLVFNFKRTITPEGNVDAYGIDTGITGKHYDRIICDDIITIKDRISKAERERTKQFVQEVRTNVIDPGKPVAFVGTPWHKNDAWGNCPPAQKYSLSDTGILSQKEIDEKKRTITPVLWACNYELKHISDDMALFKDPNYELWDYTCPEVWGQLDAAFDGDHYCALTFMGKRKDGKLQAVGFAYPGNVKNWFGFIAGKYKHYKCSKIYNEDNPDKGYTAGSLKEMGVKMVVYSEHQNKHIKISTHLYEHWPNIVWNPDTESEYMVQIMDYREGSEPDDAPDSVASLLRERFDSKGKEAEDILWRN